MGLCKEIPDTVTKFDLSKIIHLLCKKLDWIDEDEEHIDEENGTQHTPEAQAIEESVSNDRSKKDGCYESNSVHSAPSDFSKNVVTSKHAEVDMANVGCMEILGNPVLNPGVDILEVGENSIEDPSKLVFGCPLCDQKFSKENYVAAHMWFKHKEAKIPENSLVKTFCCSKCNKKFANQNTLMTHENIHTGNKPFNCSYCDYKCTTQGYLKAHERKHTGFKPYSCSNCDHKFTTSSDLKIHERIHTGDKPFRCTYCDKKFIQSAHCKKHERTHTGDKPFSCSFCVKKFSQKVHLKRHERTHT